MSFEQLTPEQQAQARARFFNAGPDDGYVYNVGPGGELHAHTHIGKYQNLPAAPAKHNKGVAA